MSPLLSVLIVDDSAVTRAVIRHAVRTSATPVDVMFEAANGAAAVALLETLWVDVVITDINMPVMNGIELLREIAARGWSHVTSIVISTDVMIQREQIAELGVEFAIAKPFRPDAIQSALETVMARK